MVSTRKAHARLASSAQIVITIAWNPRPLATLHDRDDSRLHTRVLAHRSPCELRHGCAPASHRIVAANSRPIAPNSQGRGSNGAVAAARLRSVTSVESRHRVERHAHAQPFDGPAIRRVEKGRERDQRRATGAQAAEPLGEGVRRRPSPVRSSRSSSPAAGRRIDTAPHTTSTCARPHRRHGRVPPDPCHHRSRDRALLDVLSRSAVTAAELGADASHARSSRNRAVSCAAFPEFI